MRKLPFLKSIVKILIFAWRFRFLRYDEAISDRHMTQFQFLKDVSRDINYDESRQYRSELTQKS